MSWADKNTYLCLTLQLPISKCENWAERRSNRFKSMCLEMFRAFMCRDLFTVIWGDCTRCGNALMVHPQKSLKDTNTCKREAKRSISCYRLLSVNKNQCTPFLSKRIKEEILNQGERSQFSPFSPADNSNETRENSISSTCYFQTEPHVLSLAQGLHYLRFWGLAADFKEGPAVTKDHQLPHHAARTTESAQRSTSCLLSTSLYD